MRYYTLVLFCFASRPKRTLIEVVPHRYDKFRLESVGLEGHGIGHCCLIETTISSPVANLHRDIHALLSLIKPRAISSVLL